MAKICTACGAVLEDDKKFCTECGAPVGDIAPTPQPVPTPQPAPAPQPIPTPQPRAVYGEEAPGPNSKYEPITTGGYIGIMLLMCIPIVGIILMIVWALGGCRKINKRNLARASLIMMAIGLVFGLIFGVLIKSLFHKVTDSIEQETGISLSQDKDKDNEKKSGGILGAILGAAGGEEADVKKSGDYGTNSDLKALAELDELLTTLNGEENGLGDAINEIEAINREAEAANDGWPKSLRAYPGGTATAVASYRTEIRDTSLEEMMGWIEDLKKDGFAYQDFYDFGMTEEDMLSMNGWWATDGEIYLSLSFDGEKVIIDHTTQLPDLSGLFE